jgi:hypothetical protein
LKIAAFAGTGKTSTLTLMARSRRSSGLYLAFNKAIQIEAKEKFPRTVDCRTTHSLAYRSVASSYSSGDKLSKTLYAPQLAAIARYPPRRFGQKLRLTGVQQAHLVLGTIKRFCQSADPNMVDAHVPRYGRLLRVGGATLGEVRAWSVAQATAFWQRMTDRNDDLPMGHDGYLKLWALSGPKLNAEYVLLDEAQDTNQVVLGVLQKQNSQIVYVGDRHQQIYEWRGAVNAMEQVAGCDETSLTQSFRFGEPIAAAASRVLRTLGETQRLRGNPKVQSSIEDAFTPTRAVLARTNATVIVEVLEAVRARRKPCIVGGTGELTRLLSDVYELKDEKREKHPRCGSDGADALHDRSQDVSHGKFFRGSITGRQSRSGAGEGNAALEATDRQVEGCVIMECGIPDAPYVGSPRASACPQARLAPGPRPAYVRCHRRADPHWPATQQRPV